MKDNNEELTIKDILFAVFLPAILFSYFLALILYAPFGWIKEELKSK